jgi:hypothetical protein
MKKLILTTTLILAVAGVNLIQAQPRPVEERIESLFVAFVTEKLQLTPAESQAFWPVYNEYRDKEKAIKDDFRPGKELEYMSDAEAEAFVNDGLKREQMLLDLRKDYTQQIKEVLPIRKVAMLMRVEREFKERLLKEIQERRKQRPGGGGRNLPRN